MPLHKFLLVIVGLLTISLPLLSAQPPEKIMAVLVNKNVKTGSTNDLYFLIKKSQQQHFATTDFINPAFVEATFVDASNKVFEIQARYNMRHDQVQVLFRDQIYTLYPHLVQVILVDHLLLMPQLIEKDDFRKYTYLQAEVSGKITLYKKFNPSRQIKKAMLFVKNQRGQTVKLKPKRKSILAILAAHQVKIERFVIENNLSYRRYADLKQIFEYYNQL